MLAGRGVDSERTNMFENKKDIDARNQELMF